MFSTDLTAINAATRIPADHPVAVFQAFFADCRRQRGSLPTRMQVDPLRLPATLWPMVAVIERHGAGPMRVRVAGTEYRDLLGGEVTGLPPVAALPGPDGRRFEALARLTMMAEVPVLWTARLLTPDHAIRSLVCGLFPVRSGRTARVDQVFLVFGDEVIVPRGSALAEAETAGYGRSDGRYAGL